jgi:hypothetical protein
MVCGSHTNTVAATKEQVTDGSGAGGTRTHDLTDYETIMLHRSMRLAGHMPTTVPPEATNLAPEDSGSHPSSHPRAGAIASGQRPCGCCHGHPWHRISPLRSAEDCIGVPGEEVRVRLIDAPSRHTDCFAGHRTLVELLAVTQSARRLWLTSNVFFCG